MSEILLSIRPTMRHVALEKQICELEADGRNISRSAITQRALEAAKGVSDWRIFSSRLKSLKPEEQSAESIPSLMQMRVDSKDYTTIKEKIMPNLGLTRLTTPYLILLLWVSYVDYLKKHTLTLTLQPPEKQQANAADDMTGIEMIAMLVELLQRQNSAENQIALEQIKRILSNHK